MLNIYLGNIIIEYKKSSKDINIYLKEFFWLKFAPIIALAIICIPFVIFILFVGIFSDREAFKTGAVVLIIFIWALLVIIRMLLYCKKFFKRYFENANVNGDFEYIISINNDEYAIENITKKTVDRIK